MIYSSWLVLIFLYYVNCNKNPANDSYVAYFEIYWLTPTKQVKLFIWMFKFHSIRMCIIKNKR